MTKLDSVNKCQCGAVVIEVEVEPKKPNTMYAMAQATYDKFFAFLVGRCDLKYQNCNHCMNHWGIDIDGENPQNEDGELNIVEPTQETIDLIKSQL